MAPKHHSMSLVAEVVTLQAAAAANNPAHSLKLYLCRLPWKPTQTSTATPTLYVLCKMNTFVFVVVSERQHNHPNVNSTFLVYVNQIFVIISNAVHFLCTFLSSQLGNGMFRGSRQCHSNNFIFGAVFYYQYNYHL